MPIIKKFSPREKLETFSTFISTTSDVDTTSLYFRISELNEVLTGGKNGFLIEGSEHLKETTEIKIEILDVNGNTIYYEPGKGTPDYYEGLSKVVSVHVYPDTPIGLATITIMGELKTFVDDNGGVREVPDEWKGIYNVKWETTVKVNRNLPNEDKVRFYKRPTIEIDEIVKPIFNTQIPTVTQSGVVTGFPIVPESGVLLDNFTDPTFYRLRISGSESWSLSVVGSEISIPSVNYNPTVLDVVNSKDITVSPPFTINGRVSELVEVDYTSSFLNREDRLNTDSPLSGSFARIKISDLKTFVGDVNRVKVFRRSESSLGDFEFIQEIELESNELLIDFDVAGKVQEKYGLFTEPVITEYWNSSSMDVQFNQDILFNSVNFQPDGVGQFFTNKTIPIDDGVEYTLSFGARLSGSYSSEDYIRAFISGSNTNTEFLKLKATDLLKEKRTVNQNIIPIVEDDVQLYFEVVGNGWFINNVSIRASQETAFSPDEITFIQPVPRQLQIETFDYKFEFYDINNNYIPVRVEKTKEFTGGNTTLITRGLEVIPSNQFFTYNSSGDATGQTTILFDIRRSLLTGSVTFASSAFDESGTLIDSSEYIGGQYPGLLIDQTNESAVLTAANFTGSNDDITVQYVIYEASCEDQTANVLIGRVADGRSGLGAGYVEASSVSFVRKDDKTFIPTSASLTSYFRDREDFQIQITSSILVYPSYSFDDGIDRNFIWYEITEPNVNTSIRLTDSNGDEIIEGELNAVQTDTATVEFTYTDSIGETIIATETVVIVSDGDKGDDSIVIDITPANFVFSKDETGLVENFSDGNTTVKVLQGNTPLKYDQDLTEAGTWATQSIIPTNITIGNRDVEDETNLILSGLSNLQGNVAFIEYNLIARPFYRNEFNTASVEIDTIQAFTSVRDGTNSRIVRLFSTAYDVIYDADFPQSGVSPISPIGAITLTAFQFNHTGSVFYEFYKDDVLEFGPTLTNTLVIPSGEMPFPDERAVWEVRTKENTTTSTVIATDNLDIIGSKSGRDARDISISFNPSYFIFTSSIDILPTVTDLEVSIVTQNITGFTTNSISFRSGSNTDFVSWDDFFTGKPNPPTLNETNNVYTFTLDYEDHINGRENLPLSIRAQQTVFGQTIRDIETISFVESGDPAAPLYVFDTPSGSLIRNKTGSLVLGILRADSEGITTITSGDIRLFSGSVELSSSLNGVSDTDGIDAAYRATITEEFIIGKEIITIRDINDNTEYASIAIFDVTDGFPGGVTTAIPSILVRRDDGDDIPFYEPSESIVTGKFFGLPITEGGNLEEYTGSIKLIASYSVVQNLDFVYWENIDTGSLTVEVDDKDGTPFDEGQSNAVASRDVEVIFRFQDRDGRLYEAPKTIVIQSDGVDGNDFISVENTNNLVSVDSENDGTVRSGGLDGSGTTIAVKESVIPLRYINGLTDNINLVGDNTGSWVVDSITSSSIGPGDITVGGVTFDTFSATVGDHSNLTANAIIIQYNIRGWRTDLRRGLPVEFTGAAQQTVYKNKDGFGALTVELSNNDYTFTSDSDGEVTDFNGSGTSIKIFEGATPLTFSGISSTFPTDSGSFNISTTSTGVTVGSVTGQTTDTAIFGNVTAVDTNTDNPFIDFIISGSRVDGKPFTLDRVQTFSKAKKGEDVKDFSISLSSQNYNFDDSSDTNATPDTITVTINQQNLSAEIVESDIQVVPTSQTALDPTPTVTGTVVNGTGVRTFDIVFSTDLSSDKARLPVTITVTKDSITKSTTIGKLEGGDDGEDGEDAPPIYRAEIVQNGNVTIPVSVFGAPNFSDSGVTIIGYKDEVPLTGSISTPTTNEYSASIFAKSTFITASGVVSADEDGIVFGNITGWTDPNINKTGFITYKVTFENESPPIERFVTQRLNTTSDGETGPGIVFRGEWTSSLNYKFQENNRRDAVLFDTNGDGTPETYYATKQESGPDTVVVAPIYLTGTGTISFSESSTAVTGDGTDFQNELSIGDYIYIDNGDILVGIVASITSATSLTLTNNPDTQGAGFPFTYSSVENPADYWEFLGTEDFFVAAKIAIFEESFVKNTLNVGTPKEGTSEAGIVINGRDPEETYISIGQPVIGFQQTGIFQGVTGSIGNEVAVLSLQSASADNGLSWDGSTLEVNGTVNITGESKISDRVIVGENESITIFGSDNSPYISIGQLPASQSFGLPGIFLGTNAAGTGSLSIVSTTSGLTWNGTNLNVNGTINAPAGNIGCFNINQGVLQSCNNRISIDTVNNVMEVRDNDDNVKFIANTQTGLPNPFVSDSGTLFTTASTHEISACIAVGGGFGFESYVCTMNETGSFGIFTPSITSTYTVRWNYRGTGSDPKSLVSVYACGPESFSEATLRLQIVSSSGALITESTSTSITAQGGKTACFFFNPEFGGPPSIFYSSTDQCVTFPNTVFNVNAPLVSGSTYCILVSKTAQITGFGGTSNPDGCTLPLSSCVLSTVCRDNPTYNATPSYTIVNGGGLQSVVDDGEYFRTLKLGQFNQSVQIGGGLHLVGCELNKRFIRFNPSSDQNQFWIVNTLGNEDQISGTVCKSGLVFGQGERPNSNVICTGWGTGEALMTLTTGGALITKGTVTQNVGTLSDNRLKDDLTIINSPIDKISHINGYTYTWNSASYTPGKLDGGVVAQDVEKSMPLLVGTTTIDSSEYKTVSYNGIIGLLVESVKELSNEICTLRSELHKIKCGCILTK